MEDSQHAQNIQIHKVIGEDEKISFILGKKLSRLFGQSNNSRKMLLHWKLPTQDL